MGIGLLAFALGVPSALSWGGMPIFTQLKIFSWFDFVFGNISLAVGALLICVFVGYVWCAKKAIQEVFSGNPRFRLKPFWAFSLKFLSPIAIIIILIFIKTIAG